MLLAEAGVVREHHPGVDLEARVRERGGGLAVGVPGAQSPAGRGRGTRPAQRDPSAGYSTAAYSAVTTRCRGWRGVSARVEW
ncbi:hypothetical protein STENM223S_05654 [Streptomyces tendae]